MIAEYVNGAAPSAPTREYVYSGGVLLAKLEGGAINYYHDDHLSARLLTDGTGAVTSQEGTFPFGESWYDSTSNKWKFTSYERDSESQNDYAMARFYVNRLGRFGSPDLVGGSIGDPQSLNRYSYVTNNPVNNTDPSGQFVTGIDQFLWGSGIGSNGFFGANWGEFAFFNQPAYVLTLYHSNSANFPFESYSSGDLAYFAGQGELDVWGKWIIGGGSIMFSVGGSAGGGGQDQGKAFQERLAREFRQDLADCVKELYDITLTNYIEALKGQSGLLQFGIFEGKDAQGNVIKVVNDNASYSKLAIRLKTLDFTAVGYTPYSTSRTQTNYTASDLDPEYYKPQQIHELAHSLDQIKSGRVFGSSEQSANRLMNCIYAKRDSRRKKK